jgi:cyclophilin family peptidyl-prolyl cis-trans isomerase
VLAQLQQQHSEDVRVVFRHFPLMSIHDKAALAAQAAEAAGKQGKFWEMHDLLFEHQDEWSQLSVEEFQDWLSDRAAELELDTEQFKADLNSEAIVARVNKAWEYGQSAGFPGTPMVLINGNYYSGPKDYGSLEAILKVMKLQARQFTECPPVTVDPSKTYTATLQTEKGDITIELFPEDAPMAVNSFIFLARHGWYDGITFHRVIPGQIAQTGDPTGTGLGGPGYAFGDEISPDLKFDQAGMVGMANAGPGSNGSQFFITLGPMTNLDGSYTIFGQVISGLDVAQSLTPRDPQQSIDLPPGDKLLSVTIEER